jgi:hypothetical protein
MAADLTGVKLHDLWPTAEDRTRGAAEQLFADGCGLGADSTCPTGR